MSKTGNPAEIARINQLLGTELGLPRPEDGDRFDQGRADRAVDASRVGSLYASGSASRQGTRGAIAAHSRRTPQGACAEETDEYLRALRHPLPR